MRTSKTTGRTSSGRRSPFWITAAVLLFAAPPHGSAQTEEQPFGLMLTGTLSTGGETLPDPSSPGTFLRQKPPAFGTGTGLGAELRFRFPSSNVAIGFSIDRSSASVSTTHRSTGGFYSHVYDVEDGYEATAAELTGYFYIPVGGPSFSLFMGGGCGGYWGERVFRIAGVEARSTGSHPGFGIHVLGGLGYTVIPHVTAVFTLKFRDLQLESTNSFDIARIPIGSTSIQVGTAPFSARVQANSVLFSLGLLITL